ncbi:GNAT family N-acetyltransferase [Halomonas sp. NO4]|uniref:GNAT family N-acetyltransferase n=1 Tax=Halomonas sp. NO4 TaxID=2484813 RepID=UPI0013D28EB4|nr:GNAT family N-acetyltransferase [Halomonas sp. NO4]
MRASLAERLPRRLDALELAALEALEATQPSPWSARQLKAALSDPLTVVLGIDGEDALAGHAVVARLPFEAELQALLVASVWRRQGLAGRLLAGVIDQARAWGSERLLLEVRAGNAPARALYARAGFVEDGRRRGYYPSWDGAGPREDAVLMSLPLG